MNENETDKPGHGISADELALLASYLSGRATVTELAKVEERLAGDEKFRNHLTELRSVWQTADQVLGLAISPEELEATWKHLVGSEPSLNPNRKGTSTPAPARARSFAQSFRQPGRSRFGRWGLQALAASVLLVLGLGSWQSGWFDGRDPAPGDSADQFVHVVTAPGVWREVSLRDGTRVKLGPGSTLTVPRQFGTGVRELRLEGHAFFEVAEDPARPFLVHTSTAQTRVLGTQFNVRAYPGASDTEVVVRSGRVGIGARSARLSDLRVLAAGERGIVDQDGHIVLEENADTAALLGWIKGTLSFDGVPLREAVPELERWFGVQIHLSDPALGERRITGTFEREPLDFVLQSIGDVTRSRWEQSEREVTFSPR